MEPNNSAKLNIKWIDKIINAYKRKKLQLQQQLLQQQQLKLKEFVCFEDVRKRMNDAKQKLDRQKKIDKLQSNKSHWKGLT